MLPTFAICYRAVGTVAIFCYRCTTYASYLSCIIIQIQLTLLVRFIITYSDNAINLTTYSTKQNATTPAINHNVDKRYNILEDTRCLNNSHVLVAVARNPINLLPQKQFCYQLSNSVAKVCYHEF